MNHSAYSVLYYYSSTLVKQFPVWPQTIASIMAGAVRQPIDITSLSDYMGHKVPDVKLPVSIKQVRSQLHNLLLKAYSIAISLGMDNRTPPIKSLLAMANVMSYGRSLLAIYYPRQRTRWSASTESFMRCKIQQYRSRRYTACAKTQPSSALRSTSWNF